MEQFTSPQIGLALRRLRKKHNLTQKDLANGICSQAEISKIESGTHSPTIELLYALSKRLQVPISAFLDPNRQQDSLKTIDEDLLHRFRNQDFDSIYKESQKILEQHDSSFEFVLLYKYYYYLCSYRLQKIDYRTCIVELQNLSADYLTSHYSPSMLIRIKSAIANLYSENKSYQHSINVYEEILKLNFDSDDLVTEKIRITYNFSKILLDFSKYEQALQLINEAIEESLNFKDMSVLGQLYAQKGDCLEKLGATKEQILGAYDKAYFLFELLNMNQYKKIISSIRNDFLKNMVNQNS
ncbi:helix-turn-helix domain-containing protein [uncultured Exiguobacterium sp.]|uniref:helix-turn-helix domain-containing protein n=1 Tax=uncultured Exiguobacterium sp. TaxID=202669 RepID=UPI0025F4D0AB|nr:helix-turn-helix domain-containing protein [uncultured Exiguobacterium sp.]